jgi:hypothetical protein
MCYGDMGHGKDGYYEEALRRAQIEEEQEQEQEEYPG